MPNMAIPEKNIFIHRIGALRLRRRRITISDETYEKLARKLQLHKLEIYVGAFSCRGAIRLVLLKFRGGESQHDTGRIERALQKQEL